MLKNVVFLRSGILRRLLVVATIFSSAFFHVIVFAQSQADDLSEAIRLRFDATQELSNIVVGEDTLYANRALRVFYEHRGFRNAWTVNGRPIAKLEELIVAVRGAYTDGLNSEDYHLRALLALKSALERPQIIGSQRDNLLVDLDLLASDAFLMLGSHYLAGRVNPENFDSEWFANRPQIDMTKFLEDTLIKKPVDAVLAALLPQQSGYQELKSALAQLRGVENKTNWQVVAGGPVLKLGMDDGRIATLRERLNAEPDLIDGDPVVSVNASVFDKDLEQAVIKYQTRLNLTADGVVGLETLKELNKPVGARINQIIVNLERWRWLPGSLGKRYILVNIANFEVKLFEKEKEIFQSPAIVGRTYRRTPVFSGLMTYIVFNPSWNVPPSIARNDKLPLIKKDPNYLVREGFDLLLGWGAEEVKVDPATVDWSQISKSNFPYRLRQRPGPRNALGRIKFMFPNRFNVYLHDTPTRNLFNNTKRDFSSGCIRIAKPFDLAYSLLEGLEGWKKEMIDQVVESGIEQTVMLSEPIPVHIQYWTALPDKKEGVRFLADVYNRDHLVLEALNSPPPSLE